MVYELISQLDKVSWCHAGIIDGIWHISLFCGSDIVIEVTKQVTHRIFNTNGYIIVRYWYFNLTKKSNITGGL